MPEDMLDRLFIPGGGLRCFKDRPCLPLRRTILRAKKAVAYYYGNPGLFRDPRAFISVSGGHNHAFSSRPVRKVSEAFFVRDFLTAAGVPPELLRYVESSAIDSAQNLINMVAARKLRPAEFSPQEPLQCVTNAAHGARLERYARCLNFSKGSFITLESGEDTDPAEPILLERTEKALDGLTGGERSERFFAELELRRQKLIAELNTPETQQELALIRKTTSFTAHLK